LKELSGQDFDIQKILQEADKYADNKINVEGFVALIQGHPELLETTHVFSSEEENIKRIKYMVAVDGGLASDRAFDHVLRIIKENDAIYIVYVHEPINVDLRPPLMHLDDYINENKHKGESMKNFLAKLENRILDSKKGVSVTTLYTEGNIQNELITLIDKHVIDVLVLGRQEYIKSNLPGKVGIGPIAKYLVDHAPTSVIIIK